MMKSELFGRLRIMHRLCSGLDGFSLSIGSKETRFANINADIDIGAHPEILADVCFSPFKSEVFDLIYFTEVIEHLPNGSEQLALREIYRMLKKGGTLILTTPHDNRLFTVLDLARYIVTHRHYKKERIDYLLNECNFNIDQIFIAGGSWECLCNLWYFLITFPMKKIFGIKSNYAPTILTKLSDKEYDKKSDNGYTIFCVASRK